MRSGNLKVATESWLGKHVCVLGDVMLDRFVYGQVERVSPEAPVPVLHFQSETFMLGGAGNVARNIAALGGKVTLIGALGEDKSAELIAGPLIAEEGVEGYFLRRPGVPTTVKTRFVSDGQQIMRLDVERKQELTEAESDDIVGRFETALATIDAVVLSDYAKGILTPGVIGRIIALAGAHMIPVVVDPKSLDVMRYAGATALTPNRSEAEAITHLECRTDESAQTAARRICELAGVDAVVMTRGAQGMTIFDRAAAGAAISVQAVAREVFDVSGAGDTVVAALALSLAAGLDVTSGARVANAAAGIAVGKRGTGVVRAIELAAALFGSAQGDPKIVERRAALAIVCDWKRQGLKVGFTNGCFDLLHPGHVELLKRSRAGCDRLLVALNSDASARRLKGPTRPVQNETARSRVMASIASVDLVTLFEEDTPLELIDLLKPDVLIKGADYTIETVVGADVVQAYGGKVLLVPLEAGHSTSSIIARGAKENAS
ncbi:MAG: D-glycero-beta-D-manno-heptose-7-phosphate kinase [Alphaproteobacteria bacterium]|nr:D-glycero-beta-D-manno-heptose-7-phosphate kinase [Alphaproteobacteria bacterium]